MQADQFDIVEAAGLDPENFDVIAWAPVIEDLPALLVGTYRGHNAAIRAEPRVVSLTTDEGGNAVTSWDAVAFVSRHPGMALDCLTYEERERLRAEKLTPAGADGPVGQAAVIGKSDPREVSYAPPLPAVTLEVVDEPFDPSELGEVDVAPASCGGPECVVLRGPEGVQEVHQPNSCPNSAEADRG
jgi:hypothetical protein